MQYGNEITAKVSQMMTYIVLSMSIISISVFVGHSVANEIISADGLTSTNMNFLDPTHIVSNLPSLLTGVYIASILSSLGFPPIIILIVVIACIVAWVWKISSWVLKIASYINPRN